MYFSSNVYSNVCQNVSEDVKNASARNVESAVWMSNVEQPTNEVETDLAKPRKSKLHKNDAVETQARNVLAESAANQALSSDEKGTSTRTGVWIGNSFAQNELKVERMKRTFLSV